MSAYFCRQLSMPLLPSISCQTSVLQGRQLMARDRQCKNVVHTKTNSVIYVPFQRQGRHGLLANLTSVRSSLRHVPSHRHSTSCVKFSVSIQNWPNEVSRRSNRESGLWYVANDTVLDITFLKRVNVFKYNVHCSSLIDSNLKKTNSYASVVKGCHLLCKRATLTASEM